MSNSGFVITDSGLRAASVANEGGPLIHLTKFRVGYGVNYALDPDVLRHKTDLEGPILYEGHLEGYRVVDQDTIEITCPMGYGVGNFAFGEAGLYLEDGTLFAVCVFEDRVSKIRSNDLSQTGNRYNIRAFLKLSQGASLIQPPATDFITGKWSELSSVSELMRPTSSDSNAYLTQSSTETGASIIAVRHTNDLWKFPTHTARLGEYLATLGSTTEVLVANVGGSVGPLDPGLIPDGKYLIQFTNNNLLGMVRTITWSNRSSIRVDPPLPQPPAEGSRFEIWQSLTSIIDTEFVKISSDLYLPATEAANFMKIEERQNFIPIGQMSNLLQGEDRLSLVPTGSLFYTLGDVVPPGFLEPNGGVVSRTAYSELFEVIGTTYGAGNGTTTFSLPDLRGEFIRILDNGRGVDPVRVRGSVQESQVQFHKHVVPFGTQKVPTDSPGIAPFGSTQSAGRYGIDREAWNAFWPHTNDGSFYGGAVNESGAMGTETRPRNVSLMAILKY